MTEPDGLDAGISADVLEGLAALRAEAVLSPRLLDRVGARAAVEGAVAEAGRCGGASRPGRLPRLRRGGVGLGLALGAGVAVLAGLGWSAPAGSPLHEVRLARERVVLVLTGNSPARQLSFAEDRLRESGDPAGRRASLMEAQALLTTAGQSLPQRPDDPSRRRWMEDEQAVEAGLAASEGPASHPDDAPSPGASTPQPAPARGGGLPPVVGEGTPPQPGGEGAVHTPAPRPDDGRPSPNPDIRTDPEDHGPRGAPQSSTEPVPHRTPG